MKISQLMEHGVSSPLAAVSKTAPYHSTADYWDVEVMSMKTSVSTLIMSLVSKDIMSVETEVFMEIENELREPSWSNLQRKQP